MFRLKVGAFWNISCNIFCIGARGNMHLFTIWKNDFYMMQCKFIWGLADSSGSSGESHQMPGQGRIARGLYLA